MIYRELLFGCGNSRVKKIRHGNLSPEWECLTTIDIDPNCKPDIIWDLNVLPYPFDDNTFDEIHAMDVLEHLGQQGDYKAFFAQFSELHRIIKPAGIICGLVPAWDSPWAFGDPGHTRVITRGTLLFLSQKFYADEVGVTNATDYRHIYKGDFELVAENEGEHQYGFVLKAIK
jgi:SAM-dependent methyltransferase